MGGINIAGRAVVPGPTGFVPYEKDLDQLWYVPIEGGGTPVMVIDKASGVRVASPVASPDYSQIAYIYHNSGDYSIRMINRDGTGDTEIVANTYLVTYPDWNPDGNNLIFCSYDDGKIYTVNPDGTGLAVLYDPGGGKFCYRAVYSSDGAKIAFYLCDDLDVVVIDADGTSPTVVGAVTSFCPTDNAISWMNSSNVLAFGDAGLLSGGNGKFYRVDADGTNLTQIAQESTSLLRAYCIRRAWTADDSTFIYQEPDGSDGYLTAWSAPAGGGSPTQLSPEFQIFRSPQLVFGDRVWADGVMTVNLGLISALPDGSDQQVEDGPDIIRLEYPN